MKLCAYCDTQNEDNAIFCTKCRATEFKYICENCGKSFDNGLFCPQCGVKFGTHAKTCPKCGAKYFSNACPDCGYHPIREEAEKKLRSAPQPIIIQSTSVSRASSPVLQGKAKNKWVAFFLCLFLGFIGVHKFYEGKVGMGILYIFTFGLFGIGWVIDLLVLLFKPNPYYVR